MMVSQSIPGTVGVLSVADTLNFSRSGELLHMSVSAVSRTIRRLEDELGQPLPGATTAACD